FSSRRRHTSWPRDWSSDVCSSDLSGSIVRIDEILNSLCNSIDALASEAYSTILTMDPEGHQLWHVAGPRVPRSWLPALMPRPIEIGRASCRERVCDCVGVVG